MSESLNSVFFNPWIGRNYQDGSQFAKRILVLGESHYQWDPEIEPYPGLTINCITDQVTGNHTKRFWTNIVMVFNGEKPSLDEKKKFWNSVAYYNYVQESVGFGSRKPPTKIMWEKSEYPFKKVLDYLQPNYLLVLGYRLWNKIPSLDREEGTDINNSKQPKTYVYPLNNNDCLAYGIMHPSSSRFSKNDWHQSVKETLKRAQ